MSNLYRQLLLDRHKNLRFKRSIDEPTKTIKAINPSCGDALVIELKTDTNNVVTEAGFSGDGCMVSLVATDFVLENLLGKPLSEVENINIERIEKWLGSPLSTGRYNCALLAPRSLTSK